MIHKVIQRKAEIFPIVANWFNSQRQVSTKLLTQLTPGAIINNQAKVSCIKRLKCINQNDKTEESSNKAAVLVPLCIHNGKLGLLYTLRSHKVSMNRGQVSFPGGMKDSNDASLEDTALRETWEELQISKDIIDVWGTANLIKRKHVTVLPVLGYIGEIDPKSLQINKNEVEEAFVQPLEKLCDPKLCRYTSFKNSYVLPLYLGANYKIWGLTAVITHIVMNALVPDVYKNKLPLMQFVDDTKASSTTTIKIS
ncbi:PREDICTED: nucleoside diphosphate-linked moiety X motif 8, mitochondrial [Ceratosolen solmsi marchali]|uniref:Nucleoside diphosphate-linked moiety X motif 8, mitochondrial n=1 Tax=Ceratosolen solmsi marchali TaxID=326594 RepID=A0AAJ6YQ32_9HYME|nr:PREDICTED: nucleoside diphosphate-linked moiety X motif 8, mitochondrial [Ceratosolen solmsi marchali]